VASSNKQLQVVNGKKSRKSRAAVAPKQNGSGESTPTR
jgi:hypothetical protein